MLNSKLRNWDWNQMKFCRKSIHYKASGDHTPPYFWRWITYQPKCRNQFSYKNLHQVTSSEYWSPIIELRDSWRTVTTNIDLILNLQHRICWRHVECHSKYGLCAIMHLGSKWLIGVLVNSHDSYHLAKDYNIHHNLVEWN